MKRNDKLICKSILGKFWLYGTCNSEQKLLDAQYTTIAAGKFMMNGKIAIGIAFIMYPTIGFSLICVPSVPNLMVNASVVHVTTGKM